MGRGEVFAISDCLVDVCSITTGAHIIELYRFIGKRRAQAQIAVYVYNILYKIERTDVLYAWVANIINLSTISHQTR